MFKKSFYYPVVLLGLSFSNQMVLAQVAAATISGAAKDETDAVLPGVAVMIKNLDTGITRTAITDDQGRYHAPNLALGNYEVKAELPGFQAAIRRGIELTVGRHAVVDMVLKVGEVTEQVVVTEEAPLVETSTSAVSSLIDQATMRELALNGRDLTQLALLTPGVTLSQFSTTANVALGAGKRMSIGGSRPQATSFLLDETDINAMANTTPGSSAGVQLGVDTIREFKIVTNPFSAEYGRTSAGVVTYVTRSGTNELHGSAFEFLRNSALDAKNFFDQPTQPIPPFKRNQFGATAGGPVQRNRTFFFASYEALIERLGLSNVATVPGAAVRQGADPAVRPYVALYPLPNSRTFPDGTGEFLSSPGQAIDEHYFMGRVDRQFGDSDSFFGRYVFDDATLTRPDRVGLTKQSLDSRNQYFTLQETRIITGSALNTFRFALNRSLLSDFDVGVHKDTSLLRFTGIPGAIGSVSVGGLTALGGDVLRPRIFVTNMFQYSDDLVLHRGGHSMRLGANVERLQYNIRTEFQAGGSYAFQSLQEFLTNRPRSVSGQLPGSSTTRSVRQMLLGLFLQDDYRVRENFTLNLGLRYEFITVPGETHGRISQLEDPFNPLVRPSDFVVGGRLFENPGLKNFAPRIGLAWDPFQKGKTVIRAGFGIFYEHLFSHYARTALTQNPPLLLSTTITSVLGPVVFPNFAANNLVASGQPGIDGFVFRPDQPYVSRYGLNIQQQVLPSVVLQIGYSGAHSIHLPHHLGINHPVHQILPDGRRFYPFPPVLRNPNFSTMRVKVTDGIAKYHALEVSLSKRPVQRLRFQASYTFSKVLDDGASVAGNRDFSNDNAVPRCLFCPKDVGPAPFSVKHNFVANYTYDLPFGPQRAWGGKSSGTVAKLMGDWQVSGITTVASGYPFSVYLGFIPPNFVFGPSDQTFYPDLVPGRSNNPVLGGPDRYYDPAAFSPSRSGFIGNLGRNTIRGPGFVNFDFSLVKKTGLGEKKTVEFRAEFFNLFNTPNFGLPVQDLFLPSGAVRGNAGRITGTVNTSRQIQFGLKFAF